MNKKSAIFSLIIMAICSQLTGCLTYAAIKHINDVNADEVTTMSNEDLLSCVKNGGHAFANDNKGRCSEELQKRIKAKNITAYQMKQAELPPMFLTNPYLDINHESLLYKKKGESDLLACESEPLRNTIADNSSERIEAIEQMNAANSINTHPVNGVPDYYGEMEQASQQGAAKGAILSAALNKIDIDEENAKNKQTQVAACLASRGWYYVYDTAEADALKIDVSNLKKTTSSLSN